MRAAQDRVDSPSASIVAVGGGDIMRRRLTSLTGTRVPVVDPEIVAGPGISSSLMADVEVAVVALGSEDATGLAALRSLRRWNPQLHLVVVGTALELFEDAFDCGADAWVGADADDDTLQTAIRGRWVREGASGRSHRRPQHRGATPTTEQS